MCPFTYPSHNKVMNVDTGEFDDFIRAKRPRHLPEVLTRDEVNRLFNQLKGVNFLMAGLLYGAGYEIYSQKTVNASEK